MKRKLLAILTAVCMTVSFAGGTAAVYAAQEQSTGKDEVIVTMPTTSEPEAGFDPAYGWGAGEHVHEPLIQSTLTVTNTGSVHRNGSCNRLFSKRRRTDMDCENP